jgi:septal ring factor EnvC (AmiA/AmiB activator)
VWKLILAGLLAFPLGAKVLVAGQYDAKESELKELRQSIGKVQAELQTARGEQLRISEELRTSELRIGQLSRRLHELGQSLQSTREKLAGLARQRQLKQQKLDRQRVVLSRQIRAAYAMGRQERLKILLNQQDPAMVTRMMVYYDYLNRARADHMAEIQSSLDQLQEVEAAISREKARLSRLQSQELAEKSQLDATQALREQVVASLAKEILNRDGQLRVLQQDERRLERLLAGLQQAMADIPIEMVGFQLFSKRKGKLPWPSRGRIAASFGSARELGGLRWDGVLISAAEGKEVRAVHHGRVAFADWLRGLGLLLIIDHGDGYMTLYGHNQSLFKETGEWVEAGEPVALVGRSGGHANPGVYFGIRFKGKPVNPRLWCKRSKGRRVGSQRVSETACGLV